MRSSIPALNAKTLSLIAKVGLGKDRDLIIIGGVGIHKVSADLGLLFHYTIQIKTEKRAKLVQGGELFPLVAYPQSDILNEKPLRARFTCH
jgi:hypothetical protein